MPHLQSQALHAYEDVAHAREPTSNVSAAALSERFVPITRLPLRPRIDVTWPAEIADSERAPATTFERHSVLEGFLHDPSRMSSALALRAYREEDGAGRTIAMRILLRHFAQDGRPAFSEALRLGSDEQRALAVDGLMASGARDELPAAFSDRVDAVAAKAALAYVGTRHRADYETELLPFVDDVRIEAILKLLAGIVE